ncbi:MAG TPA: metalloregulator ArsR/SmtB family transcription factor [Gemmatimonadales bacterium]|nr:metalloregulator ArsR/SmtB family transcription factor [Gemmatimonadales bacterium]
MRQPPVVTRLNALADATRGRLLLVLERHELTVSELCQALQLPQSTVSRHLRILAEGEWVVSRADGASRLYRSPGSELDPQARRLWQVVREQLATSPAAVRDAERLRAVLAERRTRSEEFFASQAAQWDRLRAELFGSRTELLPLLGLLEAEWVVGDLGCGTGQLSLALAPLVDLVIAVDASAAMLRAGKARLSGVENVEVRRGELESLPIEDGLLDAAFLVLVLPYVAEPARVVAEAARALKPGGRLLITDLMPHEHEEYRQTMGHQWLGFEESTVLGWLGNAGLRGARYRAMAPDPAARGPMLFTASARKS